MFKTARPLGRVATLLTSSVLLVVAACTSAPAAPPAPPTTTTTLDPSAARTVADLNAALKGRPLAERQSILLAGATREGAFQLYSTMAADSAQGLIDAFNKAYPAVKAQVFRTTDGDLLNKALTEVRAGKSQFDLIDVSPESVIAYKNAGAITPYDSPSFAELATGMHDPEGYWTYMYLNGVVAAWNTNNVKPEDVPKTYQDYLNPRWKNKLSIDGQDYAWAYFIKQEMGEAQGQEFLTRLAAQNPRVLDGRTNQLNLLTAGEFDLSVALFDYATADAARKGAPIGWSYLRPTMVQGEALLANKAAPHPSAALLFTDWLFSKEGMQAFVDITGRNMPRADLRLKNPSMADLTKGETWLEPIEVGSDLKKLQQDFNTLFKAG
jgi:iron(III) transport system substrate-binding protein